MTVTEPQIVAAGPLALIGHLSEYEYLLAALEQQPGLHPIIADPFSGTTGIVHHALTELAYPSIYVDARTVSNSFDLGRAIADAAVSALRPAALQWWRGHAPGRDLEGVRLRREFAATRLDPVALRSGEGGTDEEILEDALRLAAMLAEGPVAVAVDHLDDLLGHGRAGRSDPLDVLRAARQSDARLQLVLVGRPEGPLHGALDDPSHPLFRAGHPQRVKRAGSERYKSDLAVGRPWLPDGISVTTVGIVADLTAGVPAYTWAVIRELADQPAPAVEGWERYRRDRAAEAVRHIATLGALHPLAIDVVTAIAKGRGPYVLRANDGRIRAALQTLRDRGVVWQPRTREWAMADPLLGSWLRDHGVPF